MAGNPTDSYQRKLFRARDHMNSLDATVDAWLDLNRETYSTHDDPKTGETVVVYTGTTDPPDISPIVGDILQNLRNSLDHLVLELAVHYSGTLTDDEAEDVAFPVQWTKPSNDVVFTRRIGKLDPGAQTFIKSLQPHLLGLDYQRSPLWLLHELARIDRHRSLWSLALPDYGSIGIFGSNLHIETMDIKWTREPGTEIARYRIQPIDPGAPMEMYVQFGVGLAFADGPKADEITAGVLLDLAKYVAEEVTGPLRAYL